MKGTAPRPDTVLLSSPPRRWAFAPLLLALLLAGCGPLLQGRLDTRSQLAQMFPEDSQLRARVLGAYDEQGLSGAMEVFRRAHAERPPLPYYRVAPEHRRPAAIVQQAEAAISTGFTYGGRPSFPLTPPIDWSADPYQDRSWRFWLNSLQPIEPVLAAHAETNDPTYLHFAELIACDWIDHNPEWSRRNPFTWYDMAVGQRALKLAYIADAAARDPATDPATLWTLLRGAWIHGRQLARRENFNAETNHGLYQAAGLLALARALPEFTHSGEWEQLGADRLRTMFETSFSAEGVHLEHSPGYQLFVAKLLIAVLDSGLTDDPALVALLPQAEEALAWMIAPDGRLARIGDTDSHLLQARALGFPNHSVSPALAYAVTRGRSGTPPEDTHRVFPQSGCAIFRSHWPAPGDDWTKASYLFFSAAFHSRTHKHADDLTFEWWDAGRALLVDSGRYGYYYEDDARQYCESTRAHNTVEIDGGDTSRHLGDAFGSALHSWGQAGEAYFVTGKIERDRPGLTQRRTLVFRPGRWVIVVDEFEADRSHHYEQWFHLAPDLSLALQGTAAVADLEADTELHFLPLLAPDSLAPRALLGEEQPRLQGWTSYRHRTLEPNWALGFAVEGHAVAIATLLYLGRALPETDPAANAAGITRDQIRLEWQGEAGREGFLLRRGPAGEQPALSLLSDAPSP